MNRTQNMIIAKGKIITPLVTYIKQDVHKATFTVRFSSGNFCTYSQRDCVWLKNPKEVNPQDIKISRGGKEFKNIKTIYRFKDENEAYLHIIFRNNDEKSYFEKDLILTRSCLTDTDVHKVFDYFKSLAPCVGTINEDGTKHLENQYKKIDFITSDDALAVYLNPMKFKNYIYSEATPIFPFGCNKSQLQAVKNALENQISVIEGPPGTGKTQTILNIVSNILIKGKNVLIVSNNNTATKNIFNKLASEKYQMDFLVASLGNSENKKTFIEKQQGIYPNMIDWIFDEVNFEYVKKNTNELLKTFSLQEKLALTKQKLSSLITEKQYHNARLQELGIVFNSIKLRRNIPKDTLLYTWQKCQQTVLKGKSLSFFARLKIWYYVISDYNFLKNNADKIIDLVQSLYYTTSEAELLTEIAESEKQLQNLDSTLSLDTVTEQSMNYLRGFIQKKYGSSVNRKVFTIEDLRNHPEEVLKEYPIVLSSTHSARSSMANDTKFDYVIMDEASQVDIVTGALAMSVAKNIVIVGDTKQLPNVVDEYTKERIQPIIDHFKINEHYNYLSNSFLKSVCGVIPSIPRTLLKEHYRCHPQIIQFCNQQFYNNELIIMTNENMSNNAISVYKTSEGNHQRGNTNQRQIDVIKNEIIPSLECHKDEIGIIAPYNDQVGKITKEINDIMCATVHKFQGQEKDVIIMSTVKDEIPDFVDDPYLLNVAISRAKKQFFIVVTKNDLSSNSNIKNLIDYIEYNSGTITESKIHSIFDYLYSQYTKYRIELIKKSRRVSEYDSENLMYMLLQDIFKIEKYQTYEAITHFPLKNLLKDTSILTEDEKVYALNPLTHIDFLIYNKVTKKPVFALEVDGVRYHTEGTRQHERDKMKDAILEKYEVPILRLPTNGSQEKEKIIAMLDNIV